MQVRATDVLLNPENDADGVSEVAEIAQARPDAGNVVGEFPTITASKIPSVSAYVVRRARIVRTSRDAKKYHFPIDFFTLRRISSSVLRLDTLINS